MGDALTDAVISARDAIAQAIPSQAPAIAIVGVREAADGTTRPLRATIRSVTLAAGGADVLGDFSAATTSQARTFLVPRSEWPDPTPPRDTDMVTTFDGERYAVKAVQNVRDVYWKLEVRSC